jgi:mRNA-degrading endonuclease RelE of RelBE toxin-antitoxin system
VTRRLELTESLRRQLERLSREEQQEIRQLLGHVESGNPTALAPLSIANISTLMLAELEPYRADLEKRRGHLYTCQGGGYRFFVLVADDFLTLVAMAPRPKLHAKE